MSSTNGRPTWRDVIAMQGELRASLDGLRRDLSESNEKLYAEIRAEFAEVTKSNAEQIHDKITSETKLSKEIHNQLAADTESVRALLSAEISAVRRRLAMAVGGLGAALGGLGAALWDVTIQGQRHAEVTGKIALLETQLQAIQCIQAGGC